MRYHELPTLDDHELVGSLAAIESEIRRRAGSYRYLCRLGSLLVFTHKPIGKIARVLRKER